jgi:hypothetical protein
MGSFMPPILGLIAARGQRQTHQGGDGAARAGRWQPGGTRVTTASRLRRASAVFRLAATLLSAGVVMNLLELARGALAEDQIAALAATLGESVSGTRQGLRDIAVPAVLAGLVRHYGRDAATGELLAALLRDGNHGPLLAELQPALAGGVVTDTLIQRGEGLHPLLFGSRVEEVAELLTQATGLRPTSARKLLGIVVPLVLATLGRSSSATDSAALAAQLRELGAPLAAAAPAGLAAALGTRDFTPLDLPPPRKPVLWPWLLVPAITLALFFALRWVQHSSMEVVPDDTADAELRSAE